MKNELLELEIDSPNDGPVFFGPLGRRLRGRFDPVRVVSHDAGAGQLVNQFPKPIPGQRLIVNVDTGEFAVVEPLHEAEFAAIREKIERAQMKLAPPRQEHKFHLPTVLDWCRRMIEGGCAKVLSGKLPDTIEGEPQELSPLSTRRPSQMQELTKAFDRQSAALERQAAAFEKLVAELLKRGK